MLDVNSKISARLRNLLTWISITLASSFIATLIMANFEKAAGNMQFSKASEIYWWWLETVSGVGAGVDPITFEGKLLGTFVILSGFILLGSFISEFSAIVKMLYGRKEEGNITVRYNNHIVVVGYTSLTAGVVKLLKRNFGNEVKILLLSNDTNTNPFPGHVDFINDNPISYATLKDANLANATAAIVLANDRFRDPDTYSLVIASALEQAGKKLITIVELTDPNRRSLFKKINVDAFISREELLLDLLDNNNDAKLKRIILKESILEERIDENAASELL